MVRLLGHLGAALLVVACDRQPPRAATTVASTADHFSLKPPSVSGTVRDLNREPVALARVDVATPGFDGRFVLSDDRGRFQISDLTGGIELRASKAGYFPQTLGMRAGEDSVVDFTLQPIEQIAIGSSFRATLTSNHPVCISGERAIDRAKSRAGRCRRFVIVPEQDGTLAVVLTTTDGATNLAVDVLAPDGRGAQSPGGSTRELLTIRVDRGATYDVRVLKIREHAADAQDFELTTSFR